MKHNVFAGAGALAAALLLASSASALTIYSTNFNGTQLTVAAISDTQFLFDIKNPTAGWAGATSLGSFAFNTNIIGTAGTLAGSEVFPAVEAGTLVPGGLNASGCDGTGAFFCFSFAPPVAVASEMLFNITTTGTFDYSTTNVPDLKIQFLDSTGAKVGSLFSAYIPLFTDCVFINPTGGGGGGIPEPATWAMMVVGVGAIGAVMRKRRQMGLAIA